MKQPPKNASAKSLNTTFLRSLNLKVEARTCVLIVKKASGFKVKRFNEAPKTPDTMAETSWTEEETTPHIKNEGHRKSNEKRLSSGTSRELNQMWHWPDKHFKGPVIKVLP